MEDAENVRLAARALAKLVRTAYGETLTLVGVARAFGYGLTEEEMRALEDYEEETSG